jgi:hypothetical protein
MRAAVDDFNRFPLIVRRSTLIRSDTSSNEEGGQNLQPANCKLALPTVIEGFCVHVADHF